MNLYPPGWNVGHTDCTSIADPLFWWDYMLWSWQNIVAWLAMVGLLGAWLAIRSENWHWNRPQKKYVEPPELSFKETVIGFVISATALYLLLRIIGGVIGWYIKRK